MSQNLIFALHGFLGQGQDWQQVQVHSPKGVAWLTPNLFSPDALEIKGYDEYVDRLFSEYQAAIKPFQKRIFLGYSLGGRLGLHLLKKYADQFDHFIFVSTNPGLQSQTEKLDRKKNDQDWANKIKSKSWNEFLSAWNSQPVFSKNDPEPPRQEVDFDRQKLASSMEFWSLGEQQDLRSLIFKYQDKITWVVGDQDGKFLDIAEELKQKKILLGYNKIFSGHRILFSNPKDLAVLVHDRAQNS